MSTYAINLNNGAATSFDNYGFTSFCKGTDGKYYGIKADGIYLLEGADDNGTPIDWSVGMGRLSFGSNRRKSMKCAYAQLSANEISYVKVTTPSGAIYRYPVRLAGEEMITRRYNIALGLRDTYYDISLDGQGQAVLDAFELVETQSIRRI